MLPKMSRAIILYDGVCNLCSGVVTFVIRQDRFRIFKFSAIQSRASQPLLRQYNIAEDDAMKSFVLVEYPNNTDKAIVYRRSDAALRIASLLGCPWSAAAVFRVIPRPLRDAVYDVIAAHRYRVFGRADECIRPTRDILARFLDAEEATGGSWRAAEVHGRAHRAEMHQRELSASSNGSGRNGRNHGRPPAEPTTADVHDGEGDLSAPRDQRQQGKLE